MDRVAVQGVSQGVSKLVMGSMMLHEERMEAANELLDHYFEAGGNTIDTAPVYGESTLRAVGKWMAARGNRERVVLIAKGVHPDEHGPRMRKTAMDDDLTVGLERMQTDHADIYMLHRDDPNVHVGYILEGLNALLAAGKCRALGVSNWSAERIREANAYAVKNGLTGFAASSPNLSLAKPNEPRWPGCVSVGAEENAYHLDSQLPVLSWSSQGGGFFTGRFAPERTDDKEAVRVYYSDANWERLRRARELAAAKGVDANSIALAYVLNQPFPTAAIIGPQTREELQSSAQALAVSLDDSEREWLNLERDSF
jgi:aryl-alcohol dehydrogenase-like predicted oxidoreductase